MKRSGPTNPETVRLVRELRKKKAGLWKDMADRLEKPSRQRPAVNIGKLDRLCRKNEKVVIPGKLLAAGELSKPLTVAALSASEAAVRKIKSAKGSYTTLREMASKAKTARGIRIIR